MKKRAKVAVATRLPRLQAELALVQSLVRGTLARRVGFYAESARTDSAPPSLDDEAAALLAELDVTSEVEAQFEQQLSCVESELDAVHYASSDPLSSLRSGFQLTRRELTVWILCAAPQLDRRYGRLYGLVLDDLARCHASEELLQALLGVGLNTHAQLKAQLASAAPLRALGLIRYAGERTRGAVMDVPGALIDYVLGVARATKTPATRERRAALPGPWEALSLRFWSEAGTLRRGPHQLVGQAEDSLEVVSRVCARAKLALRVIDLRRVAHDKQRERVREAAQAAVLHGLSLAVLLPARSEGGMHAAEQLARQEIERDLRHLSILLPLCVTVDESRDSLEKAGVLFVPRLESSDRRLLWSGALHEAPCAAELPAGLSELPLGPSAIGQVARDFVAREAGQRAAEQLLAQAHAALPPLPARLATPVISSFGLGDLVVPEALRERLVQLCTLFTERDRVLHDWGLASRLPYGRAVSALFSGAPGTGKTMAASIVANRLGLRCYRVDLAALVSKYIGETEKNLSELFDAAERCQAVLLFDEADALFGKRTQTKSAHDRYANLETSYLLQRIENYTGVAILTSNLRQNIDAAFTRRLRLVAHFPSPGAEMRLRLWRSCLPPEAPLDDDIDLTLLSERIELAGGPIKNAVLNAACRASAARRAIRMDDLLEASKHELRAAGQAVFQRDFEPEEQGASS